MRLQPVEQNLIYFLSVGFIEKLMACIGNELECDIGDTGSGVELVYLAHSLAHVSNRIHLAADDQKRKVFGNSLGVCLAVRKFNSCKEIVEEAVGAEESAFVILDVLLDFFCIPGKPVEICCSGLLW